MFYNQLKTALRNTLKNRAYTFINILGLAVGMASCILIILWVLEELSFDRFHTDSHNIYRMTAEIPMAGVPVTLAVTPPNVAPNMRGKFPEIKEIVRYRRWRSLLVEIEDNKFMERGISLADPEFFRVFSFNFISGDRKTALVSPNSVVITEKSAAKLFGAPDNKAGWDHVIGKNLRFDNKLDLTVTGIIENVPSNSQLIFEYVIPIINIDKLGLPLETIVFEYSTYVLTEEGHNIKELGGLIKNFLRDLVPEMTSYLYLQPLTDVYLRSDYDHDYTIHGNLGYIYIYSATAVFILIIACINFINLTTARAGARAREVGIRKVVGAQRSSLAAQFLSESMIMSAAAFVLAILLAAFALPAFNDLSGKMFVFNDLTSPSILGFFAAITVLAGLISGSYPAFVLSSIKPVSTLKGSFNRSSKGTKLRNMLVVFQFTLSTIFIAGTLIVYDQLDFIRNKELGYNREQVAVIPIRGELGKNIETFKQELLKNPLISGVSAITNLPTNIDAAGGASDWDGMQDKTDTFMMYYAIIDEDYADVMGIEMAEGRFFSRNFATDSTAFVLNEAAVKRLGMDDPLGKRMHFWNHYGTIIGVMKDFHFRSLHMDIEPLMFEVRSRTYRYVLCRVQPGDIERAIDHIRECHDKVNPAFPFDFTFLDENFNRMYMRDQRTGKLFGAFAFFAVFISCLGILGLAAYLTALRRKELGIRKTLGASTAGITMMLSRDFVVKALTAQLFAFPVAWFLMDRWLREFAYRMELSIVPFLISGLLTLAVAWLTVSRLSYKAAQTNPVDALRHE